MIARRETRDSLATYFADVGRHPVQDRDTELALANAYRATGDRAAANRLVTANLRLVARIAREYSSSAGLQDLIQEGNLGLLKALERFDPDRGIRFTSYASWWIRAYILRFIVGNHRLVRIGSTKAQRRVFFQLRKELARLEREGGEPDVKELARRFEISEEELTSLAAHVQGAEVAIDPAGDRDASFAVTSENRPDHLVERKELHGRVRAAIDRLSETLGDRERALLDARWLSDEPATLQEIGERFGITRERVRQLEARMLKDLRDSYASTAAGAP
jgi:RNA polymerase sigma-32 factor